MKKIELTIEELEAITQIAFKAGERWGVTYSTWFIPTNEDQKIKMKESFDNICKSFNICTTATTTE